MEKAVDEFRICEWCGCRTNAKYRACCDEGRLADDYNFEHDLRKQLQAENEKLKDSRPTNDIVCPFCNEEDFDLIGLKNHLNVYCNTYKEIEAFKETEQ